EPRAPKEARIQLRTYSASKGMFVAIAPWDLESVERVARLLRWHAWSALYGRYPFTFELPTGWVPPVSTPRWIRIADRSLHVIRPPAVQERAWGDLQARIDSAGRSVTEARAKLAACDPRDRKRLHLKHELDLASAEHDATRRIAADVQTSIEIIDLLRACPVCLTTADVYAFEQTQNLFRCHCSECEATWGQRTCGACHG